MMLELLGASFIVATLNVWTILWIRVANRSTTAGALGYSLFFVVPGGIACGLNAILLVLSQVFGWNPLICVAAGSLPILISLWALIRMGLSK